MWHIYIIFIRYAPNKIAKLFGFEDSKLYTIDHTVTIYTHTHLLSIYYEVTLISCKKSNSLSFSSLFDCRTHQVTSCRRGGLENNNASTRRPP